MTERATGEGTRHSAADRRRRLPPLLGSEQRRVRIGLAGVAFTLLLGIFGYQVVADLDLIDAIYMTVITISTVGYGEVVPLDSAGRALTIVIILVGVLSVSFAAVSAAEFVLEGHLRRAIEGRRMTKSIDQLAGHVIVCGYGRVGVHVVAELQSSSAEVVVIDSDPEKVERLAAQQIRHVVGDASEEQVLAAAGLERASAVVAAVNGDADNVLITLTAKGIRPDVTVIARAKLDENERKLKRAGADRVVAPTTIGGIRIAHVLTRPTVADFLDRMAGGAVDVLLEEIPIREGADLAGVLLRDAQIRERFGGTVVAVSGSGGLVPSPAADTMLAPGDVLLVLGPEDAMHLMREHYLS